MPIIESYLEQTLNKIDSFSKKEELNLSVNLIKQKLEESFFALNDRKRLFQFQINGLRWCTDD